MPVLNERVEVHPVTTNQSRAHPWMANSVEATKQAMLAAIGATSIEELFEQIPSDHRLKRPLNLPPQLASESELKRHLVSTLAKNATCAETLSFLGSGAWPHHVPAVVDEIVGRTEFLTPVWGSPQSDHGRNQAWFEFNSQLGELLEMEVVQLPVYSWGCAIGHAIRMATRITGRHEVLVPKHLDAERLSVVRTYCEPTQMANHIDVALVDTDARTGRLDVTDLKRKLSAKTAAVYIENPSSLGLIEAEAAEIAAAATTVVTDGAIDERGGVSTLAINAAAKTTRVIAGDNAIGNRPRAGDGVNTSPYIP